MTPITTQQPKTKACASLRMSSLTQDTSIDIQRQRILEFADRYQYEIVAWYIDEGKSGSRNVEKRTEWLRMLAEAKTADWEVVLCFSRDRFARLDSFEVAFAKQALRQAGKRLHCIERGIANWDTPEGRVMDAMEDEQSNQASVKISRATTEGKWREFINSRHHAKQCPYGMAREVVDWDGNVRHVTRTEGFLRPDGWTQRYVPGDPDEQRWTKWIFQTYVSKDIGFKAMARELIRQGVPSPDGLLWQGNTVRRILTNPTLVGDLRLGKTLTGKFYRMIDGEVVKASYSKPVELREGTILRDTHQGIIDRPLWDLVQEKMRRRSMHIPQAAGAEGGYALSKIVFCGQCGARLYGRRNLHGRHEDLIPGYVCSNHARYGDDGGCRGWSIDEKDILPVLIDKLTEAVDQRLLEFYAVKEPNSDTEGSSQVSDLQQKLEQLDKRIARGRKRLVEVRQELLPMVEDELVELKTHRDVVEQQIAKIKNPLPQLEVKLQEWREWLASAKKNLVRVQTSPVRGVEFDAGLLMTSDTFREALLRFGCHVDVWWRQRTKKRWDVERVRIRFGRNEELSHPQTATSKPLHVPVCGYAIDLVFDAKDIMPQSLGSALPVIKELKAEGVSHKEIAGVLNERGVKTAEHGTWTANKVSCFLRTTRHYHDYSLSA